MTFIQVSQEAGKVVWYFHLFKNFPQFVVIHTIKAFSIVSEAEAGIKIARRNINNFRYTHDTTLMAESEEELKSLLMKVKEENEKAGLKHNIQNTKIMASGPITSWQIDGESMETVRDFILGASKITANGDTAIKLNDTYFLEEKLWPTQTAY